MTWRQGNAKLQEVQRKGTAIKIVHNSADRLTLEDRPIVLGVILAVVILFLLLMALAIGRDNIWVGLGMGVAAAMFYLALGVFVRQVNVDFDRNNGTVLIRTISVFGRKQQLVALSDVDAAVVETQISRSTSGGRHRRTTHEFHRPVLRTEHGVVPLNEIHVGGSGAALAVATINDWLAVKIKD